MFWYSGLARICSRVSASGAWRRMRSSQLCLVSSIAAHSSPLGVAAAPVNASSGMRTSSFPIPFRPERVGQPARRVDREHQHPAALLDRRRRRQRGRRGRLAHAAGPAGDDDLLGREQLGDGLGGCGPRRASQPELLAERRAPPGVSCAARSCARTGRAGGAPAGPRAARPEPLRGGPTGCGAA